MARFPNARMGSFSLGRVCATRGVAADMELYAGFAASAAVSLEHYVAGDWGDLSAADRAANDRAVECGGESIPAVYCWPGHGGLKIWVFTEADRSAAMVLYPEEY